MTLTDAARMAGYTGSDLDSLATHMAQRPHVAQALARARGVKREVEFWTVEGWRNELGRLMRDAEATGDLPTRARAIEMAGKHLGTLEPQTPLHPSAQALMDALTQSMARSLPAPRVSPVTVEASIS